MRAAAPLGLRLAPAPRRAPCAALRESNPICLFRGGSDRQLGQTEGVGLSLALCANGLPALRAGSRTRFVEPWIRIQLCLYEQKRGAQSGTPFLFIWRRGWDSNPRYGVTVHTLSRRAPSTARTPLLKLLRHASGLTRVARLNQLPALCNLGKCWSVPTPAHFLGPPPEPGP